VEASVAHTTVDKLIMSGREFSLQEIFTLISIIVMVVSLCITQLEREQQDDLVRKLDKLLNIKLQHLRLMNALVTDGEPSGWLS
jgi:hypothetical protein